MRKFFDFDGLSIPLRKDESTEIYLESEDGGVQRKPLTVLLGDGSWAKDGVTFTTNRLGEVTTYSVVLVEIEVEIHDRRGKYGQIRRRVLVAPMNTTDRLERWASDLKQSTRGPA